MVFFTGYFGTDEVTYAAVAADLASGNWSRFNYIGALRYGINLPNALFIRILGANEFAANLWALLCSIGEVGLVFAFAHRLWGLRAALLSAILIAFLPLHVNHAGRLLADAPLAFFITLSLFLFWIGECRRGATWYFAAGLTAGFVYWIKETVVIYGLVFLVCGLACRTRNAKWLWLMAGGTLMIAANCLLMSAIHDDPFHVYRVTRAVVDKYVHQYLTDNNPWVYTRYLFVDLKHTWIVGHLALGGIILWARNAVARRSMDPATGYVVLWAFGLFAIFTFIPISLNPITLIAKQANYMLIFLAPWCILGGYALASLSRRWLLALAGLYVVGGILLSGLEQQAVQVFTANSKATVQFARVHQSLPVYAGTNAYRAETYLELLGSTRTGKRTIRPFAHLGTSSPPDIDGPQKGLVGYGILDLETSIWGRDDPIRRLADVPPCWSRERELQPDMKRSAGYYIASVMLHIAERTPRILATRLTPPLEAMLQPRPAYVYAIPAGCQYQTARSDDAPGATVR